MWCFSLYISHSLSIILSLNFLLSPSHSPSFYHWIILLCLLSYSISIPFSHLLSISSVLLLHLLISLSFLISSFSCALFFPQPSYLLLPQEISLTHPLSSLNSISFFFSLSLSTTHALLLFPSPELSFN